ncbi:hypothetical protein DJ021_03085 [Phenylobacterium hankyongense]|uniref:Uncharacterized protein n=1 Tax=Phenylobacterium hankyongense TaxID=1813876 RepID=A0A328AX83_9CAUL|nr:hypothetical protein [Phenylobacterium hankyongense]RAK58855.1 hypothetical protein DJ021_03085 [Phenylobacterium hankyongense]
MRTLSDLEVYQRLTGMVEELERLAAESASLIGETALKTAATTLRGMASAVYEHSLSQDEPG